MSTQTPASGPTTAGAVLIDYQNLHHYLKSRLDANASVVDAAALLVRGLREHLASENVRVVRGAAYADFGGLDEHARHTQRSLYLHGIRPVYVPHTMHRNTSDLQMALDAAEIAQRFPEITTVAIVGGDRDYVPVAQALLAAGRRVVFVGFREHLTPFLLAHTGGGAFLDAAELMPEAGLAPESEIGTPVEKTVFQPIKDLPHDIDYDAIDTIERHFGQYDEIYLTPLLRRLSEEIGDAEGHDPKSLVADLEAAGAARLERRRGMPYDYTVLIVNDEHPAVLEIREEIREEEAELEEQKRAALAPVSPEAAGLDSDDLDSDDLDSDGLDSDDLEGDDFDDVDEADASAESASTPA